MDIFRGSIRNKVRFGYYISLALIVCVALVNYLDLSKLNKKIRFSLIISDLFDTTLEMRRYEKNYFLYNDDEDYRQNLRYTWLAEDIIRKNREELERLSPGTDIHALEASVLEYKSLMEKYAGLRRSPAPGDYFAAESRIREKGKGLVDVIQDIAVKERKYILSLIATSQTVLLFSVVVLAFVGFLKIHYLSRMVVRPLKQLEEGMGRIAEGKFDTLAVDHFSDIEIISLGNAFSRMMNELELRSKRLMVQSEKLISLGTMVSGVAHELNNPLSNISSSCQILTEEIDEDDLEYKKVLLRQIEDEVGRAKTTVNSLLEFSRKKDFKSGPVRLKEVVEDTVRLLQGEIPPGVELKLDIPEGCTVSADKQRLQQAVLNIVKNGIDAIPGDGSVSVTAKEDSYTVEIKVQDTGTGIEAGDLKNIFDPFFTTKDVGKGSGLGLFITREIIEEHDGTIEVESAPGLGTTFIIRLPAKEQNGIQA